MLNPLSASAILAAVGVVLVTWEAGRPKRNPIIPLVGIVFVGLAVLARLMSGTGIVSILSGLTLDFGIAFLMGAIVMAVRRRPAGPFVLIGVGALMLSGLGRAVNSFSDGSGADSSSNEVTALLVELGEDDDIGEIAGLLQQYGASYEQAFPSVSLDEDADLAQVYLVQLPHDKGGLLDRLWKLLEADTENIDFIETNRTVTLEPPIDVEVRTAHRPAAGRRANDPLSGSQWALDAGKIDDAHELLSAAAPVRKAVVAILDTGVDARHEDIRSTFLASPAPDDAHGHGTHCAGIAGAATNNGLGVASLNWEGRFVEVSAYRALSSSGMGTVESIAQAIIDATTDGADVISMSLGDYSPRAPRVIAEAVEFALDREVIVVAAAGNSNQDAANHMPANIKGVIAVSAIDTDMRKAAFSNTNTSLAMPIAAPGVGILSLVPDGGYEAKSGTSMATPLVAGLLGVMRSLDPSLTAEAAYRILVETGQEVSDSPSVGTAVNAHGAVQRVLGEAS